MEVLKEASQLHRGPLFPTLSQTYPFDFLSNTTGTAQAHHLSPVFLTALSLPDSLTVSQDGRNHPPGSPTAHYPQVIFLLPRTISHSYFYFICTIVYNLITFLFSHCFSYIRCQSFFRGSCDHAQLFFLRRSSDPLCLMNQV